MRSKRTKRGGGGAEKDNSELSVLRRKIPRLEELIQSAPDVRKDKIEQIRAKLRKGTYKVKAEKIAEKIMADNLLDEVYRRRSG